MVSNITSFLEDTGNLLSVNQKKKTSKILDYKKKIITGQAVLIRSTDKRFRNCVGPLSAPMLAPMLAPVISFFLIHSEGESVLALRCSFFEGQKINFFRGG